MGALRATVVRALPCSLHFFRKLKRELGALNVHCVAPQYNYRGSAAHDTWLSLLLRRATVVRSILTRAAGSANKIPCQTMYKTRLSSLAVHPSFYLLPPLDPGVNRHSQSIVMIMSSEPTENNGLDAGEKKGIYKELRQTSYLLGLSAVFFLLKLFDEILLTLTSSLLWVNSFSDMIKVSSVGS